MATMLEKIEAGKRAAEDKARQNQDATLIEGEVERMDAKPDDIPADVWDVIQDNGRVATDRLHEILVSPRFTRLRAGDQAKLIALAQNRAYGSPKQNRVDPRKSGALVDITADELRVLANRTSLPEYIRTQDHNVQVEDEEL